MRVISGICRGRKLIPIEGSRIRPTSDRVKEAVFNILGPDIRGARVLDLFTGTGGLGIEAISRGAGHVVFMDIDCRTAEKNLERCRLTQNARLINIDLLSNSGFALLEKQTFDIVFIDPPYGNRYIEQVVIRPDFLSLLTEETIILAKHGIKEKLDISPSYLHIARQKKYSKTMISILHKPRTGPNHDGKE
ncbi:MAG: 16S rRNA (guanine(966)-N(2))-methyltransferase RsmD [Desulfobacterales bacterium]|nr:16S rRNA (guanine(966)-N(2))-methyltransferase RsmD [Desulfobacterales bacterium]